MESETQEGEGTQPHKVIVFRHVKQERSGKAKSGESISIKWYLFHFFSTQK